MEGAEALEVRGRALEELVRSDPRATVFHLPAYQRSWWRWLGEGRARVVLVERGGELLGAAYSHVARGFLRFMGGTDVTDYQWPLALAGEEEAVARALAGFFREEPCRALSLRHLDEVWARLLACCLEEVGLKARVAPDAPSPQISLEGGYAAYMDRLSSKQRHEVRRKLRRAAEGLRGLRVRLYMGEAAIPLLPTFFRLHASSYGGKGGFLLPSRRLFLGALARSLGPTFGLALLEESGEGSPVPPAVQPVSSARLGDRPSALAACLLFLWRESVLLYNSAFDRGMAHVSPGVVLVQSLLAWAAREGYRTFDFLRGGEEYKQRLGAVPRELYRVDYLAAREGP